MPGFLRKEAGCFMACGSQHELSAIETLSKSVRRIRFDAPEALKGQKSVLSKPVFGALGSKRLADISCFSFTSPAIQAHEEIGRAKIAVVLWNFVLQDEVVAKCIPGQLTDHSVVLVKVASVMGQNQIGLKLSLEPLKFRFQTFVKRGEIAVAVTVKSDFPGLRSGEEQSRRPCCFLLSNGRAAEYVPVDFASRFFVKEAEDRAATSDFDVVRVRTQTKYAARNLSGAADGRLQHKINSRRNAAREMSPKTRNDYLVSTVIFSQKTQGASPRAYKSSNCCFSLNVSMQA